MLLVDADVLPDVLQDDPQWAGWSVGRLRAQAVVHALAFNPVIYAGISLSFSTVEALDAVVERMALRFEEMPQAALCLAGRAFLLYRRGGGSRTRVLPEFLIGAHAAVNGWPLPTRDARRFRTYISRPW